jgi:SynChlorMet cassette radical SAM/SPASM protein ScmF
MDHPPLKTMYFYNRNCNLRCRHCWILPGFNEELSGELTFPEVRELVCRGKELGLNGVKLLGGEPLLLPYIREFIDFLISGKLKIMIETNGTLIDDDIAERLAASDPFVSISLDGSSAETHALLRGNPESFHQAVSGIRKLVARNIRPQVIFCLHGGNRHDLDSAVHLARELGASSIKINYISDMGRARDMTGERLSVKEFIDIYHSSGDRSSGDFRVLFDIPPAFLSITTLAEKGSGKTCGIRNIIGVLSNGDLSICGIGNIEKELLLGNIRTHSLESVWKYDTTIRMIRENLPGKLGGVCSRCMFKKTCMGRCIANTYHRTGKLLDGDLFCGEAYRLGLFPETRLI